MSNLRDFSGKNRRFTGTDSVKLPTGSTAERETAEAGELRFNSTLNKAEYYDGTAWIIIDAPPTISNISPSSFVAASDTFNVNGSNFSTGATVKLISQDATEYTPDSVVRNSSSQLTVTLSAAAVSAGQVSGKDPFAVSVTNASGLAAQLADALYYSPDPSFTTASGTLGTLADTARSNSASLATAAATSSDPNDVLTYAIQSGSLPGGLSLNSSTAAITGTASAVGSNTTSNFTIRVTATDENSATKTADRAFAITINAPVTQTFSYTGGIQSFAVPAGVEPTYHMWGAGGGSGAPGNGGAGGYQTGKIAGAGGATIQIIVGQSGGGNTSGRGSNQNGCGGAPSAILAPSTWDSTSFTNTTNGLIAVVGGGGGGANSGGSAGCGHGNGNGGTKNDYSGNGVGGQQNSGVTTTDQSDGTCTGNCTSTILRGATGCGGAEESDGCAWPMGVWGGTWGSDAGGNGCNGGGGGGGWYGGAGGGHVTPNNGGSGGGGAGKAPGYSTYTVSNVSGEISAQNSASRTPPQTGSTYYGSSAGYGGPGGGSSGEHGRVVIVY